MSNQATKGAARKQKNRTVHDSFGTPYVLTGKIGEGGQGIVCSTDKSGVLVKVFTSHDPDVRRRWVNRVNWILNQELDGLHIAHPKAVIERPAPGYVMELMDGLIPLQELLDNSHQALLDGSGLQGFVATGGLRRRLALLRELSSTLSDLHGRGLAYGDLSPANCFVSKSPEHHQVWLIDCDNLCASERPGHGHVHSPGYGAPEVIRGESGVNSLTDAWSFAVMAFELLTHGHPFKGQAVLDGGPDQEEVRALRGELPWVYHPEDGSNQSVGGIPLDLVATERMWNLFETCFNAGRDEPVVRPSPGEWADALDAAWAMTLVCPEADCASSYYWKPQGSCPFCDHPQPDALVLEHAWYGPEADEENPYLDTGDRQVLNVGQPLDLYLAPVGTRKYREAPIVCTLALNEDGMHLTPADGLEHRLVLLDDGRDSPIAGHRRLPMTKRLGRVWALRLAHPDAPDLCPVWRFTW